jgi:hypothetical protein
MAGMMLAQSGECNHCIALAAAIARLAGRRTS